MSSNNTNHSSSLPFSITLSWILGTLSAFVSASTIFGNILVIISFFLERMLRTSTNYFIASLAVTDVLIGIFSMNLYTTYLLLGYWPLGELACDLWLSLDYTVCLTSQYTVFFITVDRFCSVKIPAKYRNWRSENKVRLMVAITWIIPSVVFFTTIMGWPYLNPSGRIRHSVECYAEFASEPIFNTILTIAYFWVTLIVMVILYGGIYKVALTLHTKSENKRQRLINLIPTSSNRLSDSNDTLMKSGNTSLTIPTSFTKRSSYHLDVKQMRDNASSSYMDDSIRYYHLEKSCSSFKDKGSNNSSLVYGSESDESKMSYVVACTGRQSIPAYGYASKLREIDSPYINLENDTLKMVFDHVSTATRGLQFINTEDINFRLLQRKRSLLIGDGIENCQYMSSPIWEKRNDQFAANKNSVYIMDSRNRDNKLLSEKRTSSLVAPIKMVAKRFYKVKSKENKSQERNVNRARKALRTITLILGAFVLSWTPFHIIVLIKGFCDKPKDGYTCINDHLYNLTYWLCYLNSPINPFCYALANVQFKNTFLRIFRCEFRRC